MEAAVRPRFRLSKGCVRGVSRGICTQKPMCCDRSVRASGFTVSWASGPADALSLTSTCRLGALYAGDRSSVGFSPLGPGLLDMVECRQAIAQAGRDGVVFELGAE